MLYASPNSEKTIMAIENYLQVLLNDGIPLLRKGKNSIKLEYAYKAMDYAIINYIKNNQNIFSTVILSKLSTNESLKELINEINQTVFYIYFVILLFLFLIIQLYFIKLTDTKLQFIFEFCFITIIML
jgi:hypothetical protein